MSPEPVATREPPRPVARDGGDGSQATLRTIIAQLADGIVVVDAAGDIRFTNPAAERLFRRDGAALAGMPFGFPLAGDGIAEIELVRPGAEPAVVTAELRTVAVDWDGEPAALVSLRDVTDRKAAEDQARQLDGERRRRVDAEAASQSKSEFLAMMSHELRTPLNAVLGYTDLLGLGLGGPLTDVQRQQLDRIAASGRHLLDLVNEVLDLARVEAGRLTVACDPFNAAGVTDSSAMILQPQAEARGLAIATHLDRTRPIVALGDEARTRQILVNLLSNAVKFTPAGGEITLTVEAVEQADPEAKVHGDRRWIAFRVCDTGRGIAADQVESVFAPFVQVDHGHTRARDGSGLGLTISRRLARLMHGDITVRTALGHGSTFTLWIPEGALPPEGVPVTRAAPLIGHEPHVRGLGDVGDALLRELEPIVDAFVDALRAEEVAPGLAQLRFSLLADHVTTLVADIAGALTVLEDSQGLPSRVLEDGADIRRLLAERHGQQRARLGWDEAALKREAVLLCREVTRAVRRCAPRDEAVVTEASTVVAGLLDEAERVSIRALQQARTDVGDR